MKMKESVKGWEMDKMGAIYDEAPSWVHSLLRPGNAFVVFNGDIVAFGIVDETSVDHVDLYGIDGKAWARPVSISAYRMGDLKVILPMPAMFPLSIEHYEDAESLEWDVDPEVVIEAVKERIHLYLTSN